MARRCDFTGKGVQTGNNVRGEAVRLRLTTSAIRTIEKRGGLDAFLLSTPTAKLGKMARDLKRRVEKAKASAAPETPAATPETPSETPPEA
jgi:large subunit ribosomal protein L28